MTRDRFIMMQLLKYFGIKFSKQSLAHANREMQLLETAQEIVGHLNTPHIGELDAISNRRSEVISLNKELQDAIAEEERIHNALQHSLSDKKAATQQKANKVSSNQEEINTLLDTKSQLMAEQRELTARVVTLRNEQEQLQRTNDKLLDEINADQDLLNQYQARLQEVAQNISTIETSKRSLIDQINELDHTLTTLQSDNHSNDHNHVLTDVSHLNQELSLVRQTRSRAQKELMLHHKAIGKYLIHHHNDPIVKQATQEGKKIVKQANALRKSIVYHHRIAGNRPDLFENV